MTLRYWVWAGALGAYLGMYFLGLLAALPASAQDWSVSGEVGVEARIFPNSPAYADQKDSALSPSTFIEPEFVVEWSGGDDRFTFKPYLKLDADDDNRSHADIREANWLHVGEDYDLVIGLDKVYWGVAESRHLVDIINQDDRVEDLDGEDKLGQPMLQLALNKDWGTTTLFVLPGFRERTFPGDDARLRGSLPISDDVTYDAGAEAYHVDFAIRWAHSIGDFDIGLSHFHGTSREPRFRVSSGETELVPHYDLIDQTGFDLQYTKDAWLLKFEAIGRAGHGQYFPASVAGVEYTLFQIFESDADLGLLAEYLYDGRDDSADAPGTPFQDDIFLGARLALNDEQDTSLLAGVIVDRVEGSTLATVEAERRLGQDWRLAVEARMFIGIDRADVLHGLRRDDVLTVRLSRFF
jgi:hypothetical protein